VDTGSGAGFYRYWLAGLDKQREVVVRTLIALLMLSTATSSEAQEATKWMVGPSGPTLGMTDITAKPSFTFRTGDTPGAYVTVNPNGTIEYGKDYTPDAAARIFWDALGFERKARNCQ
jgi:hypothetical protein